MTIRCNVCGSEYSDEEKYCPNCGSELTDLHENTDEYVFCSKCGCRNSIKGNFCSNCAAPLTSKASPNVEESTSVKSEINVNKLIIKIILIFGSIIAILICIDKIVELNKIIDPHDIDEKWQLIYEHEDRIDWDEIDDDLDEKILEEIDKEVNEKFINET